MFTKTFTKRERITIATTASALAVSSLLLVIPSSPASPVVVAEANSWVDIAASPNGQGYWVAGKTGVVKAFGAAGHHLDASSLPLQKPVVAIASTPTGNGYWLAAADGGVFSFGDARFHGSAANLRLNAPIIAMDRTATGNGYWLLGQDGGVFAFGDAPFHGRPPTSSTPATAFASTKSSRGYVVARGDTGPFGFGDAAIPGQEVVSHPTIVDVAASAWSQGAWITHSYGHVSTHGDATSYGGLPPMPLQGRITAAAITPSEQGYWLLGEDGGVFAFGDAPYRGRA